MTTLLHELITHTAQRTPGAEALKYKTQSLTYGELAQAMASAAAGLTALGLERRERVAIYLPKRFEAVISFFATTLAGGVFVPVNPLLKPEQVAHILKDCNARILISAGDRIELLKEQLADCHDLHTVISVDSFKSELPTLNGHSWEAFQADPGTHPVASVIDADMAAILYTSGSTGRPKGVVLSHKNMVTGAKSVAQYLANRPEDRLLAVLPFSFDYGFSQLTTAFLSGASVVLMDYLLPRDVIRAVAREQITGLAAVPPLWVQLAQLEWPPEATCLRYITNSGGAMPIPAIRALQGALPETEIFLMYGLTEAFRSTYLSPAELDKRPDSMGKAIPNAEIMVVREDGSPCAPGEPGELVHRGSLVAMGYWNDPEKTAERFRPAPGQNRGLPLEEIAVWSGDSVRTDEEGYLYFVSRKDEMIKTSGYRVSPTEVEEVIYGTGLVGEAAALGLPHPTLGQGILAVVTLKSPEHDEAEILSACKQQLPGFMVPSAIRIEQSLPRNQNGKIDRKRLAETYKAIFLEE